MSFVQDPHSAFKPGMSVMTHLELSLNVDFEKRRLTGVATITFNQAGETALDTRGLTVNWIVHEQTREPIPYALDPHDSVLGSALHLQVPSGRKVVISYTTGADASGLQWLPPELTMGKEHPMMFTQGQSINARSYVPCQDSPSVRFTMKVNFQIPIWAKALMVGEHQSGGMDHRDKRANFIWRMDQPIPAYLFAFAVGAFAHRDISKRVRVYAEPELLSRAAREFEGIERSIRKAEELFGPYRWERFDLLVMPSSFPYGGMENPRLACLSPTILAGDGSMLFVLDHELGHAWTGNLVTNATWNDFWLNEGWTTYLQWRLREALENTEVMLLDLAVGMRELQASFKRWQKTGQIGLTRLFTDLEPTIDPDYAVSDVPYVKGALFLLTLERAAGRERFDLFIRAYIERFAFQAITTQRFLHFVEEQLPGVLARVNGNAWVDGEFLPATVPMIRSVLVEMVEEAAAQGGRVSVGDLNNWIPAQWLLYLVLLDEKRLEPALLRRLDRQYSLSAHSNMDVRAVFLRLCVKAGVLEARAAVEEMLIGVGRIKYLRPLYLAMTATEEGLAWAREVFTRARIGYHPVAVSVIERTLQEGA